MKSVDKEKLWVEYLKNPTDSLREQIIVEYAPLVKIIAGRLSIYLGNNVEYDDLVGYGVFGLIDAIDKYDAGKDVKFETYASLRIRGSILDQIRRMDSATDELLCEELEISSDELMVWQSQLNITNLMSLNEFMEQGSEPAMDTVGNSHFIQPEDEVSQEELKEKLSEALSLLTEKERKVILLYYYEELTLKEISAIMEVSESRVSQLHTKALNKMRTKLGTYMGILLNK